jgi:hypothetical protein
MRLRTLIIACSLSLLLHVHATANLLLNPGFEAGLSNWNTTGNAAIRMSNPPPYEGSNYVFGISTSHYTVWQEIFLITNGIPDTEIDSGMLDAEYGGWQSGWETQKDQGQISIVFLDDTTNEIGRAELPFFYSNHTWVEQYGITNMPVGTRKIRYHFEGVRKEGSNNDAYLDAAFLYVVPEPGSFSLFCAGLLAVVVQLHSRRCTLL